MALTSHSTPLSAPPWGDRGIEQGPHGPAGAGGRGSPFRRADGLDQPVEPAECPAVGVQEFHTDQFTTAGRAAQDYKVHGALNVLSSRIACMPTGAVTV